MKKISFTQLEKEAGIVRHKILELIVSANASHIGSAFSCTDILVYLYFRFLNISNKNINKKNRDRFILSKGWAVSALYVTLWRKGIISKKLLETYCKDGSKLVGVSTRNGVPGIEATTGSMGHGLPVGVGMAFAAKLRKQSHRIVVLISDGECDEGSTWEAVLQAGHLKLDNLLVVVDANKWQSFGRVSEVLDLTPFAQKWQAFNWEVEEVNGHSFLEIEEALKKFPFSKNKPSVLIANTVKGKGVSIFEDKNKWHYQTPRGADLETAREELS